MKISREQILANRAALSAAIKDGGFQAYAGSRTSADAWIQFRGFSHSGVEATFDLTHGTGASYAGMGDAPRDMDELAMHVGDDADFETSRTPWSISGASDDEAEDAVERGRARILSLFAPDGIASYAEARDFLATAFAAVAEAARTSPGLREDDGFAV